MMEIVLVIFMTLSGGDTAVVKYPPGIFSSMDECVAQGMQSGSFFSERDDVSRVRFRCIGTPPK